MVNQSTPVCKQAYDAVVDLMTRGLVYRGNPDVPDFEDADHDAQSRGGSSPRIHVDSDYLASSTTYGLAGLLLHEGWHVALNQDHPYEPNAPPYTTYPWSAQGSCLFEH